MAHLCRRRRIAGEHAQQVVGRQRQQKCDKADTHRAGVQAHGPDRAEPGKAEAHYPQRQRVAQFNAITLVITPQREHHVGHHHHQRGALGDLLIEAEQHAEHRDGNQPAANAEQAAHRAQCRAHNQVHR